MDKPVFIDMRAPVEFRDGHIPGAISIPLFDDEERCLVGTIYKQAGPEEARQEGLGIVSGKLPALVRQIRDLARPGGTVVIYCWRGGMRSKSVVSVLDLMGVRAYQLLGGYKGYRRHVLDRLADYPLKPLIVTLCGSTGVGKTTLLKLLAEKNAAVIDLENLANHRGSAFGQVGLGRPATAQNFDAKLLAELDRLNERPYIMVECESKRIGNVYIPDVLFAGMKAGLHILATADHEIRVARLMEEYLAVHTPAEIADSLATLSRRLGKAKSAALLAAFNAGRINEVVATLLTDYYDPLYGYEKANRDEYDLVVDANDLSRAADTIIDYLNTIRR